MTTEKKELCDKFNEKFDNLLNSKKYSELIEQLTKKTEISKQNIINVIDKYKILAVKEMKNYEYLFNNLEDHYIIPNDIYSELFKIQNPNYNFYHKFPLTDNIKNLLYDLCKEKKVQYDFAYYTDDCDYDKLTDNERKNLFHIFLMFKGKWEIDSIMLSGKIIIDEECSKYSSLSKYKVVRDFINDNMPKIDTKIKKISFSELDNKLFECNNNENEIDNFIEKNNYKVTENTIIMACQKNIKFNVIKHLINYKVNFTENGINEIIKSYLNFSKIDELINYLDGYYKFTQENYYIMSQSKYYYELFNENLNNFKFDDKITDLFAIKLTNNYENIVKNYYQNHHDENNIYIYEDKEKNKDLFLSNIRNLATKSEENKNNILALYCVRGDDKEIIKFVKNFKCKMTTKSLLFLYKNKSAIKKKVMDLFVRDKVKPDFDVLLQYIESQSQNSIIM
jgi:hypothetical protein